MSEPELATLELFTQAVIAAGEAKDNEEGK
jgi:hypothetical protein